MLIGLLPPLLYAAAIRTSLVDIGANRPSISLLSVGLVVFTTAVVGLVAFWLLPIPLAAAIAFGAVVAPPDAVAATAIARRIGLPRSIVTILEGESLLNDATALVVLRTAIAAIGGVTVLDVTLDFLWAALGGAAIGLRRGLVVARSAGASRTRSDTALSLMAPFAAFLPAEEVHASGVIAVVVRTAARAQGAAGAERAVAAERTDQLGTIQFLLENSVFLLIGLQVRLIAETSGSPSCPPARSSSSAHRAAHGDPAPAALGVPGPRTCCCARPRQRPTDPVDLTAGRVLGRYARRGHPRRRLRPAVTMPHLEILVLGAFVVTAGTLLIQGLSLPWLARRLGVRGPTRARTPCRRRLVLRPPRPPGAGRAGEARAPRRRRRTPSRCCARRREAGDVVWERLGRPDADETPSETYRRLRAAMLDAERDEVLRIRDEGTVDHDVLDDVLDRLDLEESMIDRPPTTASGHEERVILTPGASAATATISRAAA